MTDSQTQTGTDLFPSFRNHTQTRHHRCKNKALTQRKDHAYPPRETRENEMWVQNEESKREERTHRKRTTVEKSELRRVVDDAYRCSFFFDISATWSLRSITVLLFSPKKSDACVVSIQSHKRLWWGPGKNNNNTTTNQIQNTYSPHVFDLQNNNLTTRRDNFPIFFT